MSQKDFVLPEEYQKEIRHSEFPMRDVVYNWLVAKYAKKGKVWTTKGIFSDRVFFNALLDQAWPWVPTLLFIYVVYFLASWAFSRYGIFKAILVVAVMVIIRINALVRQVSYTNRLLKERL